MTVSYTTAGCELSISGQSSQKVSVHTRGNASILIKQLKEQKKLREFVFKERTRKPGI